MSSGLKKGFRPTSFMFDHRIENCEQLVHASDQGDFERFALSSQTFVEVPNHGVASSGDQGRHVQSTAHRGSAAPDGAPTFERAAVAIERGVWHTPILDALACEKQPLTLSYGSPVHF